MGEGLMGWVPRCQVGWGSPWHLEGLVRLLERAPRGGVRGVCGVPIRQLI
jgi:hypothetical protein